MHYALVGVDHLVWSEPDSDQFVVEYDTLKKALLDAGSLDQGILRCRTYDWLPVEGKDFEVRFEAATANGIVIEGQSFFQL